MCLQKRSLTLVVLCEGCCKIFDVRKLTVVSCHCNAKTLVRTDDPGWPRPIFIGLLKFRTPNEKGNRLNKSLKLSQRHFHSHSGREERLLNLNFKYHLTENPIGYILKSLLFCGDRCFSKLGIRVSSEKGGVALLCHCGVLVTRTVPRDSN